MSQGDERYDSANIAIVWPEYFRYVTNLVFARGFSALRPSGGGTSPRRWVASAARCERFFLRRGALIGYHCVIYRALTYATTP